MCATVDEVMLQAGIDNEENRAICEEFQADMFFLPVLNQLHQRLLLSQQNFNSITAKGNFLIISISTLANFQ